MKMTILMIALFFTFTGQIVTAAMQPKGADQKLEWETVRTFPLDEKPVDIAHSLNGKYAFVLTESNVVMVYDAAGSLQGKIPVDQGVNAIAIDPLGQYLYLSDGENKTFSTIAIDYVLKINTTGAPTKGKLDAPITIAVFSDFQCPYCGKITPLLEQVLRQNEEKVKIVFKNLPLQIHDMAQPAALAALAADKQGKFWEYHDKLFAEKNIEQASFNRIAEELELDLVKFQADMKSQTLVNQLRNDMVEAQQLGITGTPAVFINGRRLKQRSMEGFQNLIDEEMEKLKP